MKHGVFATECKCSLCRQLRAGRALETMLLDLPSVIPSRVGRALAELRPLRAARRIFAYSGPTAVSRGRALKIMTMALIRHDRILRGEP